MSLKDLDNFRKESNNPFDELRSPTYNPTLVCEIKEPLICKFSTIVTILALLFTGTANTFILIALNHNNFRHPVSQSIMAFIGLYLNHFTFSFPLLISEDNQFQHFRKLHRNAITNKKIIKGDTLLIVLSGLFAVINCICTSAALLYMTPSIYQIFRSGLIVGTFIGSRLIFKREIHRHHLLGVTSAVMGFILVGISSVFLNGFGDFTIHESIIGALLMIIGIIFQSGHLVTQEYICSNYEIPSNRLVGLEGFFGITFSIVIITIASFIPCTNSNLCSLTGSLEDPVMVVSKIRENQTILVLLILGIICIKIFNLACIIIINKMGSVVRSYCDTIRTIFVWVISLSLGFDEFMIVPFVIELLGFILLVFGTYVYIGVIEIKYFNMNIYLSKYQIPNIPSRKRKKGRRRKSSEKSRITPTTTPGMSPI